MVPGWWETSGEEQTDGSGQATGGLAQARMHKRDSPCLGGHKQASSAITLKWDNSEPQASKWIKCKSHLSACFHCSKAHRCMRDSYSNIPPAGSHESLRSALPAPSHYCSCFPQAHHCWKVPDTLQLKQSPGEGDGAGSQWGRGSAQPTEYKTKDRKLFLWKWVWQTSDACLAQTQRRATDQRKDQSSSSGTRLFRSIMADQSPVPKAQKGEAPTPQLTFSHMFKGTWLLCISQNFVFAVIVYTFISFHFCFFHFPFILFLFISAPCAYCFSLSLHLVVFLLYVLFLNTHTQK